MQILHSNSSTGETLLVHSHCPLSPSYTHSLTHLHTPIHSAIHSHTPIHSLTYTHPFTQPFTHTHPFTHSLTHTHSLTLSLTHTRPFIIHSPIHLPRGRNNFFPYVLALVILIGQLYFCLDIFFFKFIYCKLH